ncbi:hypothetical protein DPM19_10735 [Actinomadura craniellae]|uniref:Protein phosphatase 2C domain-containing protein n=2 Tax=Actinomadura craniellae TaxID=2231787 RepID=A0A365H7U6_9ACTN|nr:hypothetical protein DPM19_10735 [Actinomadura craniellae]
MLIVQASEPTPGRRNEDYAVTGPGWAVVLDGATPRPGVDGGCAHGPGWLVRRLAGALAGGLAAERHEPLPDLLAGAIEAVRAAHPECDLDDPDSPSAAVAILRHRDGEAGEFDWLVLADSPIVLDLGAAEPAVIRDDRVDRLPAYTAEAVRAARNAPGGFWVASTRPEAAHQAVTGSATGVRRAALLSDGAARLVERFGLLGWRDLLDLLDRYGPAEVIRRTRAAEAELPPGPRGKRYDDATAVLLTRR